MSRNLEVAKSYFQSTAHYYVFVLQYTDGEHRQRMLGITLPLYKQLKLAEKWHEDIKAKLHGVERIVGTEAAADALNVALRLYEGMIKYGK